MGIFGNAFGWPHLIVILVIVLLLFGAPKLPGLAKSIGQSMRIFRGEMKTMKDENGTAPSTDKDGVPTAESNADAADRDSTTKPKP